MKEELLQAIYQEQNLKETMNRLKKSIWRDILSAAPVSGVTVWDKPNVCCVIVNFQSLVDSKNMAPNTYIQKAQANAVLRKLNGASNVTELVKRIQEMISTGIVRFNSTDTCRLNKTTLAVLQRAISQ